MDLNLEQAFEEPVDLSHDFAVSADRLNRPEVVSLQPVHFEGRLEKADPGFLLDGGIEISGVLSCARCLKEVPFSRRTSVSWVFAPAHQKPNAEDLELKEDELDIVWYSELAFPFDPFIDEQLQLELPMKPLCRDGCKGLCPTCGVDRNNGSCSCAPPPDERWSSLRDLIPPAR